MEATFHGKYVKATLKKDVFHTLPLCLSYQLSVPVAISFTVFWVDNLSSVQK